MKFALHETLELHEVSTFKAVCNTKAKTMQILVSDPELKKLMQAEAERSNRQLEELNGLLNRAAEEGVQA
jgi:similar to spore coat protein